MNSSRFIYIDTSTIATVQRMSDSLPLANQQICFFLAPPNSVRRILSGRKNTIIQGRISNPK